MTPSPRDTADAGRLPGQLLRFGLIGGTALAVRYGVAVATSLLMGPYLGYLIGHLCAVLLGYAGHHRVTFRMPRATAREHGRRLPRFLAASLLSLAVGQGVLHLGLGPLALAPWQALALATLAVPPLMFTLARAWVFRRHR